MEDEPIRVCPECSGEVHRLIQPVGIIFKGSGFYVTDNRAKSPTATPGNVKGSSDTPASSSSKESETSSDTPSSD
jgi:predicted nucleic acid-binding Zn ribbon protein